MMSSKDSFYQKLKHYFTRMQDYENANLKEKARKAMNFDRLRCNAERNISALNLDSSDFQDVLLLEILDWFKKEFFTWMDKPSCQKCGGETSSAGNVEPTSAEARYGAERVEDYICKSCSTHTRFPRYNDPGKLLETRTGRCGEWANCFVLCCRAADFETRLVLDFTDHVWAEVYSNKRRRWIHCDPCENKCDEPLLYECGWGKKLTYIIAFSYDNIQDVTWRYSSDRESLMKRRKDVDESWLAWAICKLRENRLKELSLGNKMIKRIHERTIVELVELMTPNNSNDKDLPGRTTGSLDWRLARHELGPSQPATQIVIKPTPAELSKNCLRIFYNCSDDAYQRSDGSSFQTIRGWNKQLFQASDVFRKVEKDWKKAYICRKENSIIGTISWKIDLSGTGKTIGHLQIYVGCECFESGRIVWKLSNNFGKEMELTPNREQSFDEFQGSETICLSAILSGGKGANAWQHSQLFRQDLNSDDLPLRIRLSFSD